MASLVLLPGTLSIPKYCRCCRFVLLSLCLLISHPSFAKLFILLSHLPMLMLSNLREGLLSYNDLSTRIIRAFVFPCFVTASFLGFKMSWFPWFCPFCLPSLFLPCFPFLLIGCSFLFLHILLFLILLNMLAWNALSKEMVPISKNKIVYPPLQFVQQFHLYMFISCEISLL